ncbi:MAG: hypothetical protein AAGC93_06125 [Cyanobacteria bacterium P01_F01_bin.53]
MSKQIAITIENGDVLTVKGDVLALKYADEFYGADEAVAQALKQEGTDISKKMPGLGLAACFDVGSALGVNRVLFVGVGNLYRFEYESIKAFAKKVLLSLMELAPATHRLVMTLHGVGYGLDEVEVLASEIAGFSKAISAGQYPESLETIVIAERNTARVHRLKSVLSELLPKGGIPAPTVTRSPEKSIYISGGNHNATIISGNQNVISGNHNNVTFAGVTDKELDIADYDASRKKHIFVAMPFAQDMEDVYHYGIQGAVRSAGFICERADQSVFTGDIMDWVKQRIESATLIIADLTGANPNVYLEVGYAWGRERPTVLVINSAEDLKFDVRGQRCIPYTSIRNLEEQLGKELKQLQLSP